MVGSPDLYLLAPRAVRELEAGDAGLPTRYTGKLASYCVVLIHVPERAVVRGIDIHRRVVAPSRVGGCLHARAVDDRRFAERHLSRCIASEPPGVANSREDIHPIDDTVAESHVALLVLGDTAHPAMDPVTGRVGTLLKERVGGPGSPDLVPAHSGHAWCCLDGLVSDERLVSLEVPIGEAPSGPLSVGQDVEEPASIGDPGLGQAVSRARRKRTGDDAAWVDRVERRRWELRVQGQRGYRC